MVRENTLWGGDNEHWNPCGTERNCPISCALIAYWVVLICSCASNKRPDACLQVNYLSLLSLLTAWLALLIPTVLIIVSVNLSILYQLLSMIFTWHFSLVVSLSKIWKVRLSNISLRTLYWFGMISSLLKMVNWWGLLTENIMSSLKLNGLIKPVIWLTRNHSSKCWGGVAALPSGGDVRGVTWESRAGHVSTWKESGEECKSNSETKPDIFLCTLQAKIQLLADIGLG